jgi:hypothetical protein
MNGEDFQDFLEADDYQIQNQIQAANIHPINMPAQHKRRLLTQQL